MSVATRPKILAHRLMSSVLTSRRRVTGSTIGIAGTGAEKF